MPTPESELKAWLSSRSRELGFDECRVTHAGSPESSQRFLQALEESRHGEMGWLARNAPKRVDPRLVLPAAQSIITLAASYHRTSTSPPSNRPVGEIARYARYADYHDVLGMALKQLTQEWDARVHPESRSLWYVDTGPILERDLAQRAGIGFVGKHTNLVSRSLGNWFLLAEILTAVTLPPDPPATNRCGRCTQCLSACPTNAIVEPYRLDARRCISYLTIELKGPIPLEHRRSIGHRIYGCDDCLAVCPWNRFAREGRLMAEHALEEMDNPDLLGLLELDEAGFRRRFEGTPMIRTKRRGLLRNVCVALGNVGDSRALPALERAAQEEEPLIAEHAQWAIGEILLRENLLNNTDKTPENMRP